ncbi:MAG: TIGR02302 family protein [Bauldia sp.]|nr:TIGR02302 family protein [Bauldia sp.]
MAIEQPRGRGFGVAEDEDAIRKRIARAVRRARLALLWEAVWPKLVPPLLLAAAFLALSSLGVWIGMLEWLRLVVLGAFAVAAAAALAPLLWLRMPSRAAALARVETATGAPHRPARSVFDTLGAGSADPLTRAVWAAHRARLLAEFGPLRAGLPSPGVARRDPYAIRYLVLLVLVVAFIAGGAGISDRLNDAFRGAAPTSAAAAVARVDAWAAPPDYTGRPPIFLTGEAVRGDAPISVPEGTTIIVRTAADQRDVAVTRTVDGADTRVPAAVGLGAGPREHRFVLDADGGVTIRAGNEQLYAWQFTVVPDTPPTMEWTNDPPTTTQGVLRVGVAVTDDYGIATVHGEATLVAPPAAEARPLIGPPDIALRPPDVTPGEAATVNAAIDVASHPWAGLRVNLRLIATDAAGQQGATTIRTVTLPQRVFTLPLSRALVEQRQILALDANQRGRVASALDLLTVAPALFIDGAGEYLALRTVYYRLVYAGTDAELSAVVDALWNLAVALEDNPVDNAGRTLEAAAEALREALANDAPDEEVQALMDQLQAAVRQYLAELAERAPTQADGTMPPPNADALDRAEIDEMIDEMRDMAQNGDRNDAQAALDRFERMMENLRAGTPEELAQQPPPEGNETLQDLADIIVEQQRIQDETFTIQQEQNAPIATPRTDEEARQLLEELRQRRADQAQRLNQLQAEQEALDGALGRLMEEMDTLGFLEPDNTLGAAREDMAAAATELGAGDAEDAVREQQEALVNLDGGARDLAEQLATGNPNTQVRRSNTGTGGNDPLGRPLPTQGPDYGDETRVPEEIDRQRAREILDAIRQRLEEGGRPEVERNYLERLLEDF